MDHSQLKMTTAELDAFRRREFPQIDHLNLSFTGLVPMRLDFASTCDYEHLRPGGTVSGPTLVTLADAASYFVILAMLGPVKMAVTTNLNINFMRKPQPGVLTGTVELLKLGRRLAVTEARLYGEGSDEMVAHAVLTYSIPPEK